MKEETSRRPVKIKDVLKVMRIHHYLKNVLVVVPLFCSGRLTEPEPLVKSLFAFAAFCMLASVVYIVNDIYDRNNDRLHPTKKNRPIASGAVPVGVAVGVLIALCGGIVVCSVCLGMLLPALLLLLYFGLNFAYSVKLKHIPLLDISVLVSGFLIRLLYGAMVTGIEVSNWLYMTVMALAFYFALGKRRNELRNHSDLDTRKVLKAYSIPFLDKNMYMCLSLANIFYALWSMDTKTIEAHGNVMIFTVPLVLLITMKYCMNIEGESEGDPVDVILHDKVLLGLCFVYGVVLTLLLYVL